MTDRRRALMMAQEERGRIPSAYQEVDWIGTNGNQSNSNVRINTEIVPTSQNYKIITTFRSPTTGTKGHFSTNNYTSYPTWSCYQQSSNIYYKYGGNESAGIASYNTSKWYNVEFGKKLIVDGVVISTKSDYNFTNNTLPLMLFNYGLGDSGSVNTRLKETWIYDGATLLADFVPCYRKNDGKIGFYDLAREKFYSNPTAGSTMLKGDDVT